MNGSTGVINWIPTSLGTFDINISVTDGDVVIYHEFRVTVIPGEDVVPDDDDDTKEDSPVVVPVILAFVLIAILIAIVIFFFFIVRRKRRESEDEAPVAEAVVEDEEAIEAEIGSDDLFREKIAEKVQSAKSKDRRTTIAVDDSDTGGPEQEMLPDLEGPDLLVVEEEPEIAVIEEIDEQLLMKAKEGPETLALPPAQFFMADFTDLPKVDEIFIMTKTGLLIQHFSNQDSTAIDEDILSSMITVVQSFVVDSFSERKTALKELRMGDFSILITSGEYLSVVVISPEEEVKKLEKPIQMMIRDLEEINEENLKDWDGNQDSIAGIEECINKMVRAEY